MSNNFQRKQCAIAAALKGAADEMEREAAELRREAEARNRLYQHQRRVRDLPSAIKLYVQSLELGRDHDGALREAGARFRLPRQTLIAGIHENERAMRAYRRWKRNRRIVVLAERYSNIELAEKFGLSPGRISQIIGAAFGRTSRNGHRAPKFLVPDTDLLPHHRANQRALKRRQQAQSGP